MEFEVFASSYEEATALVNRLKASGSLFPDGVTITINGITPLMGATKTRFVVRFLLDFGLPVISGVTGNALYETIKGPVVEMMSPKQQVTLPAVTVRINGQDVQLQPETLNDAINQHAVGSQR